MNNIDIEVMSIMECIFISSKAASNQSKFHCKHICWMDEEIQNQEKKNQTWSHHFPFDNTSRIVLHVCIEWIFPIDLKSQANDNEQIHHWKMVTINLPNYFANPREQIVVQYKQSKRKALNLHWNAYFRLDIGVLRFEFRYLVFC